MGSSEASTAKMIELAQTQSALNNIGLKETVTKIEGALIEYKLARNNDNISETARQFGVARSTLKKKLKKVRHS